MFVPKEDHSEESFVHQPNHSGNYALAHRHKQTLNIADTDTNTAQDNAATAIRIRSRAA